MLITKRSMLSGKMHTLNLDVTQEQLDELQRPARRVIQDIVPHLSASDREFLMTGITAEEWDATFSGDDEE